MMRVSSVLRLSSAIVSVCFATLATAQTPAVREQKRQQSAAAIEAQDKIAPGPAVIELTKGGSIEKAFADFDRPVRVAKWFCANGPASATTPQLSATARAVPSKSDQRQVTNNCRQAIQQAIMSQALTILYRVAPGDIVTPETYPNRFIRVVGGSGPDLPLTPGTMVEYRIKALFDLRADERVDFLVLDDKKTPVGAFGLTFADAPQLNPVRARPVGTGAHQVIIRLDRTGVASPPFLNPRWPVLLGPTPPDTSTPTTRETIDSWQDTATLVFTNRVADRQFIVTFSGIGEDARWAFLAEGFRLTDCEKGECNAILVVPPGGRGDRKVPVKLLRTAYVKNGHAAVVAFDVELFHDDVDLANPRGYFSLVPYDYLDQDGGGTKWHASTTAQFGATPDLSDLQATPDDPAAITDTASRGRANDTKVSGSARISLKQSLGSKANGEFDVRLKSGDFGTKASVSATKYRLNVYGINGVDYSGGLFDIAEPSEAIAISESGENVGFHYAFINVNHILRKHVPTQRKDVLDFKETAAERNHSATLVQVRNAPPLTWKYAALDLYAVYGRKRATRCQQLVDEACPAKPEDAAASVLLDATGNPLTFELRQWYSTIGAEVTFGFKEGWGGSAALYHSRLGVIDRPPAAAELIADRGQGTVGLVTLGYTRFEQVGVVDNRPALFTIRAQFGAGTGDDPNRPGNRSYLGANAGFAPDRLFLNLLAPAITTARGQVGAGLANKMYSGFLVTTPRWSPLQYVAAWLNVPAIDVGGRSTTIKFHDYRFNQPVNGLQHAGSELDFDFSLESPASVTYSISAAGFWPGASLTRPGDAAVSPGFAGFGPLVRGFQWSAVAQLTVKM